MREVFFVCVRWGAALYWQEEGRTGKSSCGTTSCELTGTLRWDIEWWTPSHTEINLRLWFEIRSLLISLMVSLTSEFWIRSRLRSHLCPQMPDQYGTIRAVSEGKGEEFLVGTSRNFILRGTFNDGFLVEVQVRPQDWSWLHHVVWGTQVPDVCEFIQHISESFTEESSLVEKDSEFQSSNLWISEWSGSIWQSGGSPCFE